MLRSWRDVGVQAFREGRTLSVHYAISGMITCVVTGKVETAAYFRFTYDSHANEYPHHHYI